MDSIVQVLDARSLIARAHLFSVISVEHRPRFDVAKKSATANFLPRRKFEVRLSTYKVKKNTIKSRDEILL